MTSPATVAESILENFDSNGFLPYEKIRLGKRLATGVTLHEAIRNSLGMRESDSIYMYWEWRDLKPSFDAMWVALDAAASKIEGRRTSAIAFCSPESRNLVEIKTLFDRIDFDQMSAFPSATRRPTKSEAQVRFTGKLLGAILMAMGTLESVRDSGFGDLFSSLAKEDTSNVNLLALIDDALSQELGDLKLATPPQSIVVLRALGWAIQHMNETRISDELPPFNLSEFFLETESSANWSGMSDKVVLRRLLAMAPEEGADASKRAIEKFLGE